MASLEGHQINEVVKNPSDIYAVEKPSEIDAVIKTSGMGEVEKPSGIDAFENLPKIDAVEKPSEIDAVEKPSGTGAVEKPSEIGAVEKPSGVGEVEKSINQVGESSVAMPRIVRIHMPDSSSDEEGKTGGGKSERYEKTCVKEIIIENGKTKVISTKKFKVKKEKKPLQRSVNVSVNKCFLCGIEVESNAHLFLHCKVTTNLWNMFFCLMGINWVMPRTTLELLNTWKGFKRRSENKHYWKLIPHCIWWIAWKERNSRCFEDKACSLQVIKLKCLSLFYFWCKQDFMEDVGDLIEHLGSL